MPSSLRVRGGHDVEQRRVDAVGAGGQEGELTAALAAAAQERLGVLEVVAGHVSREDALGRNRRAVRGDDERDLAGRDHDQRHA